MKKILVLFVFTLSIISVQAQQAVGALMGTVINDMSGDVVPNAKVSLEDDGAHVKYAMTDDKGNFRLYNIEAGTYDVLVTALGFQPIKVKNVPIQKLENTEMELSFAGEGYSKDTIEIDFKELIGTSRGNNEPKKTDDKSNKKTKDQKRLERAAAKLD